MFLSFTNSNKITHNEFTLEVNWYICINVYSLDSNKGQRYICNYMNYIGMLVIFIGITLLASYFSALINWMASVCYRVARNMWKMVATL